MRAEVQLKQATKTGAKRDVRGNEAKSPRSQVTGLRLQRKRWSFLSFIGKSEKFI
jgi:hypothetical protein